jgi:hypothetical protein
MHWSEEIWFSVLVGEREENKPLEKQRHIGEYNIKMDLKKQDVSL